MSVIKQISIFNGSNWDTPVDIGANAENIDFTYTTGSQAGNTAALSSILPAQVLTANRVLTTDSNGKLSSSDISSGVLNTALSGASTVSSLQSQIDNSVRIDGSNFITNDLSMRKNSNLDFTKSNNGLSTNLYSGINLLSDKSNKVGAKIEGLTGPSGNVGTQWFVRNYNSSGEIVTGNQKGITILMDKSGNLTYTISLPDSFIDALKFLPGFYLGNVTSVTTYNCTGTISNSFHITVSENKKIAIISGRIRITNFVRTGFNSGINFTLPFTPIFTCNIDVGFCAEKPNLFVTLHLTKNSTTGQLTVTETFANATNGTLSFVCPNKIVRIAE